MSSSEFELVCASEVPIATMLPGDDARVGDYPDGGAPAADFAPPEDLKIDRALAVPAERDETTGDVAVVDSDGTVLDLHEEDDCIDVQITDMSAPLKLGRVATEPATIVKEEGPQEVEQLDEATKLRQEAKYGNPPGLTMHVEEITKAAGVPVNPDRLFTHPESVVYENPIGDQLVMACNYDERGYGNQGQPIKTEWSLRGMLPHYRERIAVADDNDGEERDVVIDVMPTTKACNDVLDELAVPEDSKLPFEEVEGVSEIKSGPWIRSFARDKKIPHADINPAEPLPPVRPGKARYATPQWSSAYHDLNPANHVKDRLLLSFATGLRNVVVEQAQHLDDTYDDALDLAPDDKNRPREIGRFLEATDRLDVFSYSILEYIKQLDKEDYADPPDILDKVEGVVQLDARYLRPSPNLRSKFWMLQGLGMLPEDYDEEEARNILSKVFAEVACGAAAMFARIDELRPYEGEDPDRRATRRAAYAAILEKHTDQSLSKSDWWLELALAA